MMRHSGPYEDLCDELREATNASILLVLVVGGNRGSDWYAHTIDPLLAHRLPGLLRFLASEMERSAVGSACEGTT